VGIMRGTIEWFPPVLEHLQLLRRAHLPGDPHCRLGSSVLQRRCTPWALPSHCTLASVNSARPIGWGSRSNGTGSLSSDSGNRWV
jgi:hypothetical protein